MSDHTGLGRFADLANLAKQHGRLQGKTAVAKPGPETRSLLRSCLGFDLPEPASLQARQEGTEVIRDGVRIRSLSWQLPYGPATEAWLLMPAEGEGPWPGVVAMHDHGGYRWVGKEKIAEGPAGQHLTATCYGPAYPAYGGRACANELAKQGFCVLAHDVFSWGSRRFDLDEFADEGGWLPGPRPADATCADLKAIGTYNAVANQREHTIAKWCEIWGSSLAGIIAYEDRVATSILAMQNECSGSIASYGLSGGAARSLLLAATDERITAAVAACLMTTYDSLAQHRAWLHSWQMLVPGWTQHGDWSDIAACRAPMPLFVAYGLKDDGFAVEGMRAADARIAQHYADCNASDAYSGHFAESGHELPVDLQEHAAVFLKKYS